MWRIWACLSIHVMDRRGKLRNSGRLVTLLLADGKTTKPIAPNDIVAELNALDTVPRLDRHDARRCLRELERLGWVRVVGSIRKHTRIFLYARPLKFRTLGPLQEPKDPDLGGQPPPQIPLNPSDHDYLRRAVILPIRAALVKTFRRTIRAELKAAGIDAKHLGVDRRVACGIPCCAFHRREPDDGVTYCVDHWPLASLASAAHGGCV
jgi:hypothetical protein